MTRRDHPSGGAREGGEEVFKLQFHKLKPQRPMTQDQALPKHPCSWQFFLCLFPSFSFFSFPPASPGLLQPSTQFGFKRKNVGLWRDTQEKSTCHHPTSCHPLSAMSCHQRPPACGCRHPTMFPRSGERDRHCRCSTSPSLGFSSPHPKQAVSPRRAPANPLLATVAFLSPATTSKDQPLKQTSQPALNEGEFLRRFVLVLVG